MSNTSTVSQLIKPWNVSKPVCSNKATKCNICNTSSVSQFTKPVVLVHLYAQVKQLNVMFVMAVVLVNSLNH